MSDFGAALRAALAPLGFEFVPAVKGYHHAACDLVLSALPGSVRVERIGDGRVWHALTRKRNPTLAAKELAGQVGKILESLAPKEQPKVQDVARIA